MILCLLPQLVPLSHAASSSGSCGENATWSFDEKAGILTISGTGPMTDYDEDTNDTPWRYKTFYINKIVISEGITHIGDYAFEGCSNLKTLDLPSTVKSIGNYAYANCLYIKNVDIPNHVESIGDYAFYTASSLRRVTIPESVTSIGVGAFSTYYLEGITVAENNPAYWSDSTGSLYTKDKTTLLQFATHRISATYTFPEEVTTLAPHAFEKSAALQYLEIPNTVTTIGSKCFTRCSYLKKVSIPASVTQIAGDAFERSSLESIAVDANNPNYSSDGSGVLFNKTKTHLIQYPTSLSGSYVMPESVTTIRASAFEDAYKLTSVTVSSGVRELPSHLFDGCSVLEHVTLPQNLVKIGNYVFSRCDTLKTLTFGDKLEEIGYQAFSYSPLLTSLTFPKSLKTVDEFAFYYCTGLESVEFTGGLTALTPYIFGMCKNLKRVILPGTLRSISECAFYKCDSLAQIAIPKGITSIGDSAFSDCIGLLELTLPDSVTSVGSYAFADCPNLVSLTLPGTITEVGTNLERGSSKMGHVVFTGTAEQWMNLSKSGIYASTVHTDAKGTEAHWITENGTSRFYCDLCQRTLAETTNPLSVAPFADVVPGEYYYDPVLWAVDKSITTGVSSSLFAPGRSCTRGQIVTFLWRAAGSPEPRSTENPFTDVNARDYYYKAILWAVEQGITNGMSKTAFAPDKECTRGQVVTFLWRFSGSPAPTSGSNPFGDVETDAYYHNAVLWAVEQGITNGVTATSFAPARSCTRGQIVTFLYRALA